MGLYMPCAIFALCVGCAAFNECFKETPLVYSSFDVTESLDNNNHKVQPVTLPQTDIWLYIFSWTVTKKFIMMFIVVWRP